MLYKGKAKTEEPTVIEQVVEEYNSALGAYRAALNMFNWADKSMFDVINDELTLAEKRLSVARKRLRALHEQGYKIPYASAVYVPVRYHD